MSQYRSIPRRPVRRRRARPRFFAWIGVFILAIALVAVFWPRGQSPAPTPSASVTPTPSITPGLTGTPETSIEPSPSPSPEDSPPPSPSMSPLPLPLPTASISLTGLSKDKIDWYYMFDNGATSFDKTGKGYCDTYGALYRMDAQDKSIYLTFDCGYENGNTEKILDVLKKHNKRAVFFITGFYMRQHPDIVNRMVDEGHVVGNHTDKHPALPGCSDERLYDEIIKLGDAFEAQYGQKMTLMRPPEGQYSEYVLAYARQQGYTSVFWDFAYPDWDPENQKGADYVYNRVTGQLHNGMLLLLHAISSSNADALDRIISEVTRQGYEIKLLQD